MNQIMTSLMNQFKALNVREQWMVFFAGLAILYAILNVLFIAPVAKSQVALSAELLQAKTQLAELKQQHTVLVQNPVIDPDAESLQKITHLNDKIQFQNQALIGFQNQMVKPAQMSALLKQLMRQHANMRLIGMKTLPPENYAFKKNLSDNNQTQAAQAPIAETSNAELKGVIYKHGLELKLTGNYMDLLDYAVALNRLSKQVFWEKAELSTKEYPQNELTLTVYTLSLDETWLSI